LCLAQQQQQQDFKYCSITSPQTMPDIGAPDCAAAATSATAACQALLVGKPLNDA
jgi:hypothetical protein